MMPYNLMWPLPTIRSPGWHDRFENRTKRRSGLTESSSIEVLKTAQTSHSIDKGTRLLIYDFISFAQILWCSDQGECLS